MAAEKILSERRESPRFERTRRRILDSADRMFLAHGFAGATTDMIQADSGVSKSTLYSYFPTKDALFRAMCKEKSAGFEQALARAVSDERDPRLFLSRFGLEFLRILLSAEGLAFHRLMVAEAPRFPELGTAFYHAGIKGGTDMIETHLAAAHDAGQMNVPCPPLSAEHFIGMIRGDIHLRVLLNIGTPPNEAQLRSYTAVTVDYFLSLHRPGGDLPSPGPHPVR